MTRRQRIVTALSDALKTITTANGYKTEAGKNVQIEQWFVEGDYDYLINLFEEDDEPQDEVQASALIRFPLQIELHAKIQTGVTRWARKHQLISDVKKCLELYSRDPNRSKEISTIGKPLVRKIKPEAGSQYVIALLEVSIEYHERTGDPDY